MVKGVPTRLAVTFQILDLCFLWFAQWSQHLAIRYPYLPVCKQCSKQQSYRTTSIWNTITLLCIKQQRAAEYHLRNYLSMVYESCIIITSCIYWSADDWRQSISVQGSCINFEEQKRTASATVRKIWLLPICSVSLDEWSFSMTAEPGFDRRSCHMQKHAIYLLQSMA
jgi:hypothetical protein